MDKPKYLYHISNRLSDDETILKPNKNVDIIVAKQIKFLYFQY